MPPPSHSPKRLCSTSPKFLGGGDKGIVREPMTVTWILHQPECLAPGSPVLLGEPDAIACRLTDCVIALEVARDRLKPGHQPWAVNG
ncbi:hypothetical protein Pla52n_45850 [Stieleria varia]|uniref:Uncharacterized protein n=1 Tax=Stieleria varia TaxID=2528005 RepID=A0A5C6AMC7_9BACT|nr:hypothetical protein Pla52n_45850 [Stieleria varia]